MESPQAYHQCIRELDINGIRSLWSRTKAYKPMTDHETLIALHYARTMLVMAPFRERAYSHSWLSERDLPSGLPDNLRSKAERIYPVVKGVVGISVNSKYPQVITEVRGAMEEVVENAYADGKEDPAYIKPRMMEARAKALKRLF